MFSKISNLFKKSEPLFEIVNDDFASDSEEEREWKKSYKIAFDNNKKYGIVTPNEEIVVPFSYESITSVFCDVAIAKLNNLYGIINTKNEVLVDFKYKYLKRNDYFFMLENDNRRKGILNIDCTEILPVEYEYIFVSQPEFKRILARKGGLYALFDYTGKKITEHKYQDIVQRAYKEHGNFGVCLNDKYGVINSDGKELIPFEFLDIKNIFDDTLADVQITTRMRGLFNTKKGKVVHEYTEMATTRMHTNNLFVVKVNNKWGAIDSDGNVVTPFEYDNAKDVENSLK